MKDIVLTINGVEPGLRDALLIHEKEMGVKLKGLVLVDSSFALDIDRPKDDSGIFTEIICNFDDQDEMQKLLKPYLDRIVAVTCRFEASIQTFRKLIPFIPYVETPSESSLLWSTEKPLMRDRLHSFNPDIVPKYQYLESSDINDISNLLSDFSYPVIVKPSSLASSLLVTKCDNEYDLKICLRNTFRSIDNIYKREHRTGKPGLLVEEMMQGNMYSTDAYVNRNGDIYCLPLIKVITADSIGLPGFYGYRCVFTTNLPKNEIDDAFTVAKMAVKALNLRSTTAHIELFRTPQGWKIIELGARIGGYREALYREGYGINHYYNDLAIRMGKEPVMPTGFINHSTCLNIYADKEGTIESIIGIEEARKLSSTVFIESHAKPGDKALFASNGGRLVVDAILSNKDPELLEKDVVKLHELLKINIKEKAVLEPRRRKSLAL